MKTFKCPYGQLGDVLWTRETWQLFCPYGPEDYYFGYKASPGLIGKEAPSNYDYKSPDLFFPSIHMPKAACRMWDVVKAVRVERLQDINHADAIKEGVYYHASLDGYVTDDEGRNYHSRSAVESFIQLWISINGAESWQANPWVWVVEFEPCEMPTDFLTRKNS